MNARSLIVPGLVFFAGAVFGRLFGVKPLVRGAMTVATMSGMIPDAKNGSGRNTAPARRLARRTPRRRSAHRRSHAA
jgi:hypothetical protein